MADRTNLPSWAVDIIRDGASREDLAERGDRAVWNELGRTALSAQAHGWTRVAWQTFVLEPQSKLGRQAQTTSRGKVRNRGSVQKTLDGAWERASKLAFESPTWTAETVRAETQRRVKGLRDSVADADAPFTDSQRLVLGYVADLADQTGRTFVNLPRRDVMAATGLGERATRTALERLEESGVLFLSERGRPAGGNAKRRRANSYVLPEVEALHSYLSRETRQVGPPPKAGGTPHLRALGTPAMTGGTPVITTNTEETNMTDDSPASLTLTLTASEREAVLRALSEVRDSVTTPALRVLNGRGVR